MVHLHRFLPASHETAQSLQLDTSELEGGASVSFGVGMFYVEGP